MIRSLREIRNESKETFEEIARGVNPSTEIISYNPHLEELEKNQDLGRICKALHHYDKVIAAKIPIDDSCIIHCKIKNESFENLFSKMTPVGIKSRKRIRQEWGGSVWGIEYYNDEEMNDFIYCEEAGKYKMQFLFETN